MERKESLRPVGEEMDTDGRKGEEKTGRGSSRRRREARGGRASRGGAREQQPPGRVLFTLEDLKPLKRKGEVRLEGETGKRGAERGSGGGAR